MKKIYAELGFGNDTFLSTEVEQGDTEYRIPKFVLPKKIKDVYFRFWIFKKVFIFSIPEGIKIKSKNKNNLKILFGVGGTGLRKHKKVVIAGSASSRDKMNKWVEYWNGLDEYVVTVSPRPIAQEKLDSLYPKIHKNFFEKITEADVLFIANEDKNDISGYIGAETFAELAFGVAQNLLENKNIKIIIAKMPAKNVQCFDEIVLWKRLGWISEIESSENL